MRLEFNIAVVDDDFENEGSPRSRSVNRMIDTLKRHIESKGFIPQIFKSTSMQNCLKDINLENKKHNRRIDLYISDNNLGESDVDKEKGNDGIDLYYFLRNTDKLSCDFILYTRSDHQEIVNRLSKELVDKKDPNLFTRFTFVSRPDEPSDNNWYEPIKKVLDHVITQREELNNLRGLYAQVMSQIHIKLEEYLNEEMKLKCAIDAAFDRNILCKIKDPTLQKHLHYNRQLRNGLLHYDEEINHLGEYRIQYNEDDYYENGKKRTGKLCIVKEEEIAGIRIKLIGVKDRCFQQLSS